MPHFLPDLIADPGSFIVGTFVPTTPTELHTNVRTILSSAGWTEVASNMWQSSQSPWWDHDATPPSTYKGIVKLKITAQSDGLYLQAFNWDEANFSPSGRRFLDFVSGHTYKYNACPFQAMVKNKNNGNSFLVSTLHTPKFEQTSGLIDAFLLVRDFSGALTLSAGFPNDGWVYIENSYGRYGHSANPSVSGRLCFVLYRNWLSTAPCGIYNATNDPGMADPALWYPFMSPPTLAWSNPSGNPTTRGWLWNSLIVGKGYASNKILNISGYELEGFTDGNYGGSSEVPGTLFFVNVKP